MPRAAKKPRKRVYYAHAMCMYGRKEEREELRAIRTAHPRATVVNPGKYQNHPEKLADTMGFCLKLVAESDTVVFSRLLGKITAGVGKEVNHALRLGKPVYEVLKGKLVRRSRSVRYVSRSSTIRLYRAWRERYVYYWF